MGWTQSIFIITSAFICTSRTALAVTATGELKIRKTAESVYSAPGSFGDDLPSESDTTYRKLIEPSGDDKDGCDPVLPYLNKNVQVKCLRF